MYVSFSPIRMDATLSAVKDGDLLILNDAVFDFAPMEDGDVLLTGAIASPWIAGPVSRTAGEISLTLVLPYAASTAADAQAGPMERETLRAGDGPLPHPGLAAPAPDAPRSEGQIDWNWLRTAAELGAEARAVREAAINLERERRIEAGDTIIVGDQSMLVTGRAVDQTNLANLALAAQARLGMGDVSTIRFRDGLDQSFELTPPQVLELHLKAVGRVSAIYDASWQIKAMADLPDDIADDGLWP